MPEIVVPTLVAELVRKTGRARIRAIGTSMVPSIWPGDELLIQRIFGPLIRGQVVAWHNNERIFIHRVVMLASEENSILTRGDRLSISDPPCSKEQIIGIVTHVFRNEVPISLSKRLPLTARLLRLVSRLSDWPAFLFIVVRQRISVARGQA